MSTKNEAVQSPTASVEPGTIGPNQALARGKSSARTAGTWWQYITYIGHRYRQWGLYMAFATVLFVLGLTISATLVLSSGRTIGISTDPAGHITWVLPGSEAERTGAVTGATMAEGVTEDFVRQLNFVLNVGETTTLEIILPNGEQKTITARAIDAWTWDRTVLFAQGIAAICFAILGIPPMLARRRHLTVWLLYALSESTAIMLITGPARLFAPWVAGIWAVAMPAFGVTLFHLHSRFPMVQFGTRTRPAFLAALYGSGAAVCGMTFTMLILNNWGVQYPRWFTMVTALYLLVCILGSIGLLFRVPRLTRNPEVRADFRLMLFSALVLVIPLWLVLTSWALRGPIDYPLTMLMFAGSVGVAVGYNWTVLRYDPSVQGIIERRKLLVIGYGIAILAGWFILNELVRSVLNQGARSLLIPNSANGSAALPLWGLLAVGAMLFIGGGIAFLKWLRERVFSDTNHVRLLRELTEMVAVVQSVQSYVDFFTNILTQRIKSKGCAVLLADESGKGEGRGERMLMHGHTQGWGDAWDTSDADERHEIVISDDIVVSLLGGDEPMSLREIRRQLQDGRSSLLDFILKEHVELVLPLRAGTRLVGLVLMGGKDSDEGYSRDEIDMLTALGRYAAITAVNVTLIQTLQEQVEALSAEKARTAELSRHVFMAKEEERDRVARRIHDTVIQYISLLVQALDKMRTMLGTALGAAEDVEVEIATAEEVDVNQIRRGLRACTTRLAFLLEENIEGIPTGGSLRTLNVGVADVLTDTDAVLGDLELVDSLRDYSGARLESTISRVREIGQMLRDIYGGLRPSYFGVRLTDILAERVGRIKAEQQMQIEFSSDGKDPPDLHDKVKDACVSICELALANALTHADAHVIRVGVACDLESNVLILTISDDGRGFSYDPQQLNAFRAGQHYGVLHMHEHALQVGGHISLQSSPGRGTSIILSAPLLEAWDNGAPERNHEAEVETLEPALAQ